MIVKGDMINAILHNTRLGFKVWYLMLVSVFILVLPMWLYAWFLPQSGFMAVTWLFTVLLTTWEMKIYYRFWAHILIKYSGTPYSVLPDMIDEWDFPKHVKLYVYLQEHPLKEIDEYGRPREQPLKTDNNHGTN